MYLIYDDSTTGKLSKCTHYSFVINTIATSLKIINAFVLLIMLERDIFSCVGFCGIFISKVIEVPLSHRDFCVDLIQFSI